MGGNGIRRAARGDHSGCIDLGDPAVWREALKFKTSLPKTADRFGQTFESGKRHVVVWGLRQVSQRGGRYWYSKCGVVQKHGWRKQPAESMLPDNLLAGSWFEQGDVPHVKLTGAYDAHGQPRQEEIGRKVGHQHFRPRCREPRGVFHGCN